MIEDYEAQIANLPDSLKATIRAQLVAQKEVITEANTKVSDAVAKFEQDYKELLEEYKQKSIEVLANLETEINNQITAAKATLDAHRANYEANKEAVQTKIAEYRATLNA